MTTTTTIDIDTTQQAIIADDISLTNHVHQAAALQLILNAAETRQQAHVEAAKKAFDEATRESTARRDAIFAGITAYCVTHRDRLFPMKGKTRAKTFAILQHKLQFRSSDSVEAPKDIVARITALLRDIATERTNLLLTSDREHELNALEMTLRPLLRQPEPELNKDNAKAARDTLPLELGISVSTTESFKLAFNFTPEQAG